MKLLPHRGSEAWGPGHLRWALRAGLAQQQDLCLRTCLLCPTSISDRSCWDTRSKCRFPTSGSGRGPGGQRGAVEGVWVQAQSSPQSPRSAKRPRSSRAMRTKAARPQLPFLGPLSRPVPYRPPGGCASTPPAPHHPENVERAVYRQRDSQAA